MLTKDQYKALRRYRDTDVPVGENGLSEIDQYLLSQKYIESAQMDISTYAGIIQVFSSAYRITEHGRAALTEYEQQWKEKVFQLGLVALGAVLTLLVEGVILLFS